MNPPVILIHIYFGGSSPTGTGRGSYRNSRKCSGLCYAARLWLSKAALMPVYDERNILHIGPPLRAGDPEITPAMVEAVVSRIREAGILSIWAVLREDVYETRYGDGEYLYLRGVTFKTT